MADEESEHLQDLRRRHQRRLRELERQAATFGASTPPEVRIEIEDIQTEIARIDAALDQSSSVERLAQIAPPKTHRHNLPAQTTSLIGRTHEASQICALLRQPAIRLVTLTGPGGTGKTRLGLQVAAALFDDFPNGVCFVALAPLTDRSLVLATIAQALGLRASDRVPLADELKAYLRDRHILLLLDNFEQLIDAAPQLNELLTTAPGLKLLVTSRIVLQIYGEREFAVQPLDLPDLRHLPNAEQLSQYDAVRLFIERAVAKKSDFTITNANAPAVAQICARLDGLPLAIELAAARIKFLSPQALLEKLEHRLNVVVGGARDLPARQQTLRGAIDWSYGLLEPGEQKLFTRFAVFVGGASVAAVEAICNADGDLPIDLIGGLESLVNKSLLYQAETANGEPRFAMLETIREYAIEKLEHSGAANSVRDRHQAFFQAYISTLRNVASDNNSWHAQVELEHDNLRAALAWSQATPAESVTTLQLGNALAPFWLGRGYYREGQRWLEQALAQNPNAPPLLRASVFQRVGSMVYQQGDYNLARGYLEQSLALYRTADAKNGIANVLRQIAWIDYFTDDLAKARTRIEESLALHRETGNKTGIAIGLTLLGRLAANSGDIKQAKTCLEESLALHRQTGDLGSIGGALERLGDWLRHQDDYSAARQLYEEGLAIRRRSLGNRQGMAGLLVRLASVVVWQHEFERAAQLFDEGLALYREVGARRGVAWTLSEKGWAAQAQADYAVAREYYQQSRDLFWQIGERGTTASQIRRLGDVALAQGEYETAESYYQETLQLWQILDNSLGIAMSMRCLGKLAFRQNAYDQAIKYFQESLALFRTTSSQYDVARVLADLARALRRQGDLARASEVYEESTAIAREIDRPSAIVGALEGLADLVHARGNSNSAARLLATAERIREEHSIHRWPADRLEYDALVGEVRAALGEAAFAQAWADGRGLTLDLAIAEGLSTDPRN